MQEICSSNTSVVAGICDPINLKHDTIAGSLWFYSKDEATNFDANIRNNNFFKSFEYKAKLLENTATDGNNSILRNATIARIIEASQ